MEAAPQAASCMAVPILSPGPVRHAHPAAECALPALGSPSHLTLAHRQVPLPGAGPQAGERVLDALGGLVGAAWSRTWVQGWFPQGSTWGSALLAHLVSRFPESGHFLHVELFGKLPLPRGGSQCLSSTGR